MSADNGIYVLETTGENGQEYRIAYSHAIDNIYGDFDPETNHWVGNTNFMDHVFGQSKVYYDIVEAMDEAEKLAEQYTYLEDGVCLIADFKNLQFGN